MFWLNFWDACIMVMEAVKTGDYDVGSVHLHPGM